MALYEFLCKKCSNEFNLRIPMSQITKTIAKCPKCKSKNTKRIYSQCNFKITSERIEMAKKQGLNIEKYEEIKEKRDKKQKEKLQSGHSMANDDVVSSKLRDTIARGI